MTIQSKDNGISITLSGEEQAELLVDRAGSIRVKIPNTPEFTIMQTRPNVGHSHGTNWDSGQTFGGGGGGDGLVRKLVFGPEFASAGGGSTGQPQGTPDAAKAQS
jgi:hypothetical protein